MVALATMSHSYTCNAQHIVFATKGRRRIIDSELEARLFPYLGGVCRELGGKLIRVNGDADHLHLLTYLPATIAPADAIRKIKGGSSKWIHETFSRKRTFGWQRGYGLFGVSQSKIPVVAGYIDRQKEHHRRQSFEDEFVELLRLHGIEFDPRFLWPSG